MCVSIVFVVGGACVKLQRAQVSHVRFTCAAAAAAAALRRQRRAQIGRRMKLLVPIAFQLAKRAQTSAAVGGGGGDKTVNETTPVCDRVKCGRCLRARARAHL